MTAQESLDDTRRMIDATSRASVANDRLRILRILQRHAESVPNLEVKRLLVAIAEEVQQGEIVTFSPKAPESGGAVNAAT